MTISKKNVVINEYFLDWGVQASFHHPPPDNHSNCGLFFGVFCGKEKLWVRLRQKCADAFAIFKFNFCTAIRTFSNIGKAGFAMNMSTWLNHSD